MNLIRFQQACINKGNEPNKLPTTMHEEKNLNTSMSNTFPTHNPTLPLLHIKKENFFLNMISEIKQKQKNKKLRLIIYANSAMTNAPKEIDPIESLTDPASLCGAGAMDGGVEIDGGQDGGYTGVEVAGLGGEVTGNGVGTGDGGLTSGDGVGASTGDGGSATGVGVNGASTGEGGSGNEAGELSTTGGGAAVGG